MKYTALEISEILNGKIDGISSKEVTSLNKIEESTKNSITFLGNKKYIPWVYKTKASIIIVSEDFNPKKSISATLIRVKDPYIAFVKLLHKFHDSSIKKSGINDSAVISASSKIGKNVSIGHFSCIGENVVIGKNVVILNNVNIDDNVSIGNQESNMFSTLGTFNEFGETKKLPKYNLTNLTLNTQLNKATTGFIKINNVFDEKYETVKGYTESERNIVLGFKRVFGTSKKVNH